ncbi:MAG: TonB-dependent receptor [Flavobacteriales bacterium]|nr:TonB-dependent receptor [Flavobacteriales bacterium]
MRFLILAVPFFLSLGLFSQDITQTIRGKVIDKDAKFTLIGVNVIVITDTTTLLGASTDINGNYRIENVPVGRHKIKFSYLGYRDVTIPVVLTSAKELILNMELEESMVQMEAVEIKASKKGEVINEMATVSVRQFSVEETDKYAGSRSDPARMASNFAGVQGADDSRNDIIVRGNSPLGILWRVEGIDIPNPNHFAISGSSGGPVSILNNKTMASSDFFTGAFPAEYGNSISGVFDLKLRNGNNQKHEFTGQLGFLGTEVMAEGPINKTTGSSYLGVYRYSTVSLFSALGIDIGTDATPIYQDLNFKLNFPNQKGGFSLFGIAGKSNIDILISEQEKPEIDLYGENDRDQRFGSGMAVLGATFTRSLNEKTYMKATFAGSIESQAATHDFIIRNLTADGLWNVDSLYTVMDYRFTTTKYSLSTFLNRKTSKRGLLKFGFNTDLFVYNLKDSIVADFEDSSDTWISRWDHEGEAALIQPYVQYRHKFSDELVFNIGIHSSLFTLNQRLSPIEPRMGMRWNFKPGQSLSLGFGLHSQLQPMYTYFYHLRRPDGSERQHNLDMDFTKSFHYVIAYDYSIAKNLRMKAEAYYQDLFNIPVETNASSFSLVNQGSGFARFFPDTLVNNGTGTNYGMEFTLEKFFSASYYFMITGSLYESKYKGSDGIERNTDYNGNYAVNGLVGKEFQIGEKSSLGLGAKVTWAGGRRFGVVDTVASNQAKEVIFADSLYNDFQFRDYFRADFKINYKINQPNVTHEIAIDLVNVFNIQNILSITYAPVPGDPSATPFRENYQLGFLPIFYYKIDF